MGKIKLNALIVNDSEEKNINVLGIKNNNL